MVTAEREDVGPSNVYTRGYNRNRSRPKDLREAFAHLANSREGISRITTLISWASCRAFYGLTTARRTFRVGTAEFRYLPRVSTTERAIEIPWVLARLEPYRSAGKKILEIGNVLQQWAPFAHDVVDKYELVPGIMNEDIVSFKPVRPYDVAVSVSTLEHVGLDEAERRPEKFTMAVENVVKNCLKPNCQLIATTPIGYNSVVDRFLLERTDSDVRVTFMVRGSILNTWRQKRVGEVVNELSNGPPVPKYPGSSVVALWELRAPGV